MIVGVPKEIKSQESRVAITPEGVGEFVHAGHEVIIETCAGLGSAITDNEFVLAGAKILESADAIWQSAHLILKVKEPIAVEYPKMRRDQTLFTYLHLAASKECTDALVASKTTAIAYETVESNGQLPLLAPMSEVAGRMATQVGATALQKPNGGRGVLLGGVPGVAPGKVVVIGGGVAGLNAAVIAMGMGADVTVIDRSVARLQYIDSLYLGRIKTLAASHHAIEGQVSRADLVVGAVLVHGAKAPKLVSNSQVRDMKPGSVLVDIAIDQGGCFEDSRPTTHADPTYPVHSSIFYCVANMPGAVPVASTYALTNATLPYALAIANKGWRDAVRTDYALALGLNVHDGKIFYEAVARAHNYECSILPS
jgi:alanine dehydrogenase